MVGVDAVARLGPCAMRRRLILRAPRCSGDDGPSTSSGAGGGADSEGKKTKGVSEADLEAFMAEMEARELGSSGPGRDGSPRRGQGQSGKVIREVDEDPVDAFLDSAKERAEATSQAVAESGRSVLQSLNKFLVFDFFFIVFALVWLITGVLADKAFGWSGPAELWFSLWTPVFQPAIGILMLGSIVTGTVDNILDKD